MLPLIGEIVNVEYLNIDEIEAVCWICQYHVLAYLDNYNMRLKLKDIGRKELAIVKSIDSETGRIELNF